MKASSARERRSNDGRRTFLKNVAATTSAALMGASQTTAGASAADANARPKLGLVASLRSGVSPADALGRVKRLGFPGCQLSVGLISPEAAGPIARAMETSGVEITALMTLGAGQMVWDLRNGPKTIGVVPPATRSARVDALKRASTVGKACRIPAVHTHCGFIPEDPNTELYAETVSVLREVGQFLHNNGQILLMETGQETPITLLRTINDVGLPNLAVNLDTANLILYGKGEAVGALDVLGPHIRGLHAKDGLYPTDPYGLGKETAIGKGRVRFPELMAGLKSLNYTGPITIEREISGPQQEADILASKKFLTGLIEQTWKG